MCNHCSNHGLKRSSPGAMERSTKNKIGGIVETGEKKLKKLAK